MVEIKKRSGQNQQFDRDKLKRSLKQAGANDYDAEEIASNIEKRVTVGTSTQEIREWVYIELRAIPPARIAAEDYYNYKKPKEMAAMR